MSERALGAEAQAELSEAIARLAERVRLLAEHPGERGEPDPELVNAVFRDAHSVKGLAGLFGETELADLAHAAEDLLDGLRMGRVALNEEVEDLLQELPQACEDWLERRRETDLPSRLRHALGRSTRSASPAPGLPAELRQMLTSYEEHRASQVIAQGDGLYALRVGLAATRFDLELRRERERAATLGELLAMVPVAEQPDSQTVWMDLLIASPKPLDQLPAQRTATGGPPRVLASPRTASRSSLPGKPRTVRVELRRLDRFMEVLDELHLSRQALARVATRLQLARAPASLVSEMLHETRRIERRLEELQRAAVAVRMVPLHQLFARTQAFAERLAKELNKEIEVQVEGGDVEIDRVIGDALTDSLVHLVRNAVDHGIESPAGRSAAKKQPRGKLSLRAAQQGGMVILEVKDDGAGIDANRIRQVAEARGLLQAEDKALETADVVRLLLTPGFSTADVGPVSGRGVGLDAVRAQVVSFSGFLEVASELGTGTTVTLALPSTLALVRGLLVRVSGRRYALPVSAVWEVAPLAPGYSTPHELSATGELLSLVAVSEIFGLPASSPSAAVSPVAAVVGPPGRRVGLVVDALEGQRDLVVKPLGEVIGAVPGVAGLARLEVDEPILVLDVAALTDEALHRPALREPS